MPITDKTSWQLSKHGALQSFESEALFLPVPAPERVIERRIAYLLEKLEDDDAARRRQYFLSRGIRLKVEDIAGFTSSLNKIFVESRDTARWIGGLANHDIRRLLELTKDAIASPHLKLEDLIKAHFAGTSEVVPQHRLKHAIIKKRYDVYPVGEHSFVQNLFALVSDPPTSPLLGVRILRFLRDAAQLGGGEGNEYVAVENINEYFASLGIHPQVTMAWLDALVKAGLVLNYDPTVIELDSVSRLELSPSGDVHLGWATSDVDYVQAMKDITPLRDRDLFDELIGYFSDYKRNWQKALQAFVRYLLAEDTIWCTVPEHASFAGQGAVGQQLRTLAGILTAAPLAPRVAPLRKRGRKLIRAGKRRPR